MTNDDFKTLPPIDRTIAFGFDESKVKRDGGKFSTKEGSGGGDDAPADQNELAALGEGAADVLGGLPGGMDSVKGNVLDAIQKASATTDTERSLAHLENAARGIVDLHKSGRTSDALRGLYENVQMLIKAGA